MIELVALGDYHTAVGFLLASPPEQSARYYRDALCTLALAHAAAALPDGRTAVTAGLAPSNGGGGGAAAADAEEDRGSSNAASLLWQVGGAFRCGSHMYANIYSTPHQALLTNMLVWRSQAATP